MQDRTTGPERDVLRPAARGPPRSCSPIASAWHFIRGAALVQRRARAAAAAGGCRGAADRRAARRRQPRGERCRGTRPRRLRAARRRLPARHRDHRGRGRDRPRRRRSRSAPGPAAASRSACSSRRSSSLGYFPYFWSHGGQTPGMRLGHLRVVLEESPDPLTVGHEHPALHRVRVRRGGALPRLPVGVRRPAPQGVARHRGPDDRRPRSSPVAAADAGRRGRRERRDAAAASDRRAGRSAAAVDVAADEPRRRAPVIEGIVAAEAARARLGARRPAAADRPGAQEALPDLRRDPAPPDRHGLRGRRRRLRDHARRDVQPRRRVGLRQDHPRADGDPAHAVDRRPGRVRRLRARGRRPRRHAARCAGGCRSSSRTRSGRSTRGCRSPTSSARACSRRA